MAVGLLPPLLMNVQLGKSFCMRLLIVGPPMTVSKLLGETDGERFVANLKITIFLEKNLLAITRNVRLRSF